LKIKVSFLSDYVTKSFNRYLKDYDVFHYDIAQIETTLMQKIDSDVLIIILNNEYSELENLKFLIKKFRKNNKTKILISNFWYDFLDISYFQNIENYNEIMNKNLYLSNFLEISDVNIINIYNIIQKYGINNIINKKNLFLFQTPFTKDGFEIISKEIKTKIELFYIKRKKVLVLDADNTLWGGIVGEEGVEGIKCDETYPGILYKKFQEQLKEILKSGIVLTLVSKNNFEDVKEVFDKKNMPLKWDDFLIKKINWNPKSQNIKEISLEINVGLDSLIFIDDNPFEIEEVKNSVGVDGILVNKDNMLSILDDVRLKAINITQEDKNKLEQYKAEQKRTEVFKTINSIDDFIKNLNIKINYWINNKNQLKRITQLINKTNQFNLTTKRYSESEVEEMMQKDKVFSFQVEDKFGDMGIVSVVIVKNGIIDTFLMSCRVLGRKIEEQIMQIVLNNVKLPLKAVYIKTAKNSQIESLYERLGFKLVTKTDNKKEYIKE
jgi:FkbH-like protein